MTDPTPDAPVTSGALAVWLKLIGLLAGLFAVGALTFWLTKLLFGSH